MHIKLAWRLGVSEERIAFLLWLDAWSKGVFGSVAWEVTILVFISKLCRSYVCSGKKFH